jgi:Lon protease-like protein
MEEGRATVALYKSRREPMMDHTIHSDGLGITAPGTISIPDVIPIFPLPKTVLLPGEILPLHIFESRYRDMVRDALASHRVVGIVEPLPESPHEDVGLSRVRAIGCVGFIAQHEELPDGRFLLWLLGLERFHIDRELEPATAYRQVQVSYRPIEQSAQRLAGIQPLRHELRTLLPTLVDTEDTTRELLAEQMKEVSDTQLVALACQILELPSHRKQEILEADTQTDRFLKVYEDVYLHMDDHPEATEVDPAELN